MIQFIQGIFYDLASQITKMLADLNALSPGNKKLLKFHANTIGRFQRLYVEVNQLINSGELEVEEFLPNNISRYYKFNERYQSIEQYCYQPVMRFGSAEEYLNSLIDLIYLQIKCTHPCPLIAAMSNSEQYYWAYPHFYIIAVPLGDEKNLLNVPDLYHEIAHFIFDEYGSFILRQFLPILEAYYDKETKRLLNENPNPSRLETIKNVKKRWEESWIEEFSCDLIATYLTGVAYAWTNLKITTLSSGRSEVYKGSVTHPSDESRMQVIIAMLEKLALTKEAEDVKKEWNYFLSIVNVSNPKPSLYKFIFPPDLLHQLTTTVFDVCETAIGLNSYPNQMQEFEKPVSKILNEAWENAFNTPSKYSKWEQRAIEEIKLSFLKATNFADS
jgi:hypothetical protein